jgi:hypothetical protein
MSIDPRMGRTLLVAFVAFGLVGALLLDRPRFMPIDLAWHGEPCLGVGLDATLHGAQADSQLTWAVDRTSGVRIDLVWPVGYEARFTPALVLLNDHGVIVGHEGDLVIGHCGFDRGFGGPVRVDATDIRPPTWQPGDG